MIRPVWGRRYREYLTERRYEHDQGKVGPVMSRSSTRGSARARASARARPCECVCTEAEWCGMVEAVSTALREVQAARPTKVTQLQQSVLVCDVIQSMRS